MGDSAGDNEPGINLTGFLYGNIDENGQLEDDILDENAKQNLTSLDHLGLGSLLNEIIIDNNNELKNENETNNNCPISLENEDSNEDYHRKSPTALDFSDINELADNNYDEVVNENKVETEKSQADDENVTTMTTTTSKPDTQSMLPPAPVQVSPENKENLTPEGFEAVSQQKFETPLACMLPSKYKNIKVTELFPDFRPNKVLRFSRSFGPSKSSSFPKVWRGANRRKNKKKKSQETSDSGSDQDKQTTKLKDWVMNYGPIPDDEDKIMSDDETKLLFMPREEKEEIDKLDSKENDDTGIKTADWRYGPAQYWYDRFNLSENGEEFNYGFKLAEEKKECDYSGVNENDNNHSNKKNNEEEKLPDDAFLMVSQLHWEDDVVWNVNKMKHKRITTWSGKTGEQTPNSRLAVASITTPLNVQSLLYGRINQQSQQQVDENYGDIVYSMFPVENEELVYGLWEDEIIWDPMNMKKIPKPKILTLDPNDENIILSIPEDTNPASGHNANESQQKVKNSHRQNSHCKKSKIILGDAGLIDTLEEDAPEPPPESSNHDDPFNISNDMYYMPLLSKKKVGGGSLIQHSTPVVELRAPFIPTHMSPISLRNFHREPLKRFSRGPLSRSGPHPIHPLLKNIKNKSKQREQERIASGGGDVFFMRTAEDLSGKDGEIVLVEFSEEHPPLINQVGMCSKFKNYYKRRPGNDYGPKKLKYGEPAVAQSSLFLGGFAPGQTIQAIENNMYRAPIYEHTVPQTDFLIIRTHQQYYIREIDALFVAGQECPLYEVPGPNSKKANNFVRDFLLVFIYRLFSKSTDTPRRIRMEDIRAAFPSHSESSIRKRLKLCADFKRTGMNSNWWVLRPDFRLPNEEEIRALLSPEQCCAYFSMIAAEQRLKDAGYGGKFLFTAQDDDNEEIQGKMEDEIKVAPWHTTRAYIQTMEGKCLLQLTGPADPTGQGEGFSYIRVPNKPTITKEEQELQAKRTVKGTDADLRKLRLPDAKALLREKGLEEERMSELSRWDIIAVVRTLSTAKTKAGEEGMTKYSRGNFYSVAEYHERYKEECQRIFDLQNRVLASSEVLSTDEGESNDDNDDTMEIEEMGKNLENMLANKKTGVQLSLEKEEQERQELIKMMDGENNPKRDQGNSKQLSDKKKDSSSTVANNSREQGQVSNSRGERILKITRTYRNAEGEHYTRTEIVRKPAVIDGYIKLRNSNDESLIKQLLKNNDTEIDEEKLELKREKRRVQEKLRRIKRNEERLKLRSGQNILNSSSSSRDVFADRSNTLISTQEETSSLSPFKNSISDNSPSKRKKLKLKPDLKLKCGGCGNVGHMRTNKACPLYQNENSFINDEQNDEMSSSSSIFNTYDQDLVNVEGTKIKFASKRIQMIDMQNAGDMKRKSFLSKTSKDSFNSRKRRRATGDEQCDYLKSHQKSTNRRRTDPAVVMATILETILNEMRDLPDVQLFLFPVNAKKVPDYYNVIVRPMDLQTIRENLRQKKYSSRKEFLEDVNQIVENSSIYNGPKHLLTLTAQKMLDICVKRLGEKEDKLIRLEKEINPLLDDNDQVALTFILDSIINSKIKSMPEIWPFLKPVNKKQFKDYYNIIKEPMNLETIFKKVSAHKYQNRHEFLRDIELILDNCILYNGKDHPFVSIAKKLLQVCEDSLNEFNDYLTPLECNVAETKRKILVRNQNANNEKNYTIPESESANGDSGMVNLPDQQDNKSAIDDDDDDDDFVDVEGDIVENERTEFGGGETIDYETITAAGSPKIKDVLKEDLQFSSEDDDDDDDDDFQVVPFDGGAASEDSGLEVFGEMGESTQIPIATNDNSEKAAMGMVQLDDTEFYINEQQFIQQEESMDVDVDPNYDPSDFLFTGLPSKETNIIDKIQDDLAVSDSDEEMENDTDQVKHEQPLSQPDEDGDIWF